MKKVLFLIYLLISANIANATNWTEIGYKLYKEVGYQEYGSTYKSAWFKILNPGDWEKVNDKKIWYRMTLYKANCSNKTLFPSSVIDYGLKNEVLSNYNFPDFSSYYNSIVPESIGEVIYYSLCGYKY